MGDSGGGPRRPHGPPSALASTWAKRSAPPPEGKGSVPPLQSKRSVPPPEERVPRGHDVLSGSPWPPGDMPDTPVSISWTSSGEGAWR